MTTQAIAVDERHLPLRTDGAEPDGIVAHDRVAVRPGSIPSDLCERAIAAMQAVRSTPGHVLRGGRQVLDPTVRCCRFHPVSAALELEVRRRLEDRTPPILRAFGHARASLDGPYFVSYPPGAYFRVHRDTSEQQDDPPEVRARIVSLVAFFNGRDLPSDLPTFDGGALVVHGPGSPRPIRPEAGALVAFDSRLLHEVSPVREGVRFAAVAWLFNVLEESS